MNHPFRTSFALAVLTAALATGGCATTSLDEERAELRATVHEAVELSNRVTAWRSAVGSSPAAGTLTEVEAFQAQAEDILERIDDVDDEVTNDVDLADIEHALTQLSEVDLSTFETASPAARASLLDQFERAAQSIGEAARRVAAELA